MPLQRCKFLLRCIRFDDKETRQERLPIELAPIRKVLQQITRKCETGFHMSFYTTIDEMLPGFTETCPFRIYIPSKPNKYV